MKELNIEEKARAYDEVLNRMNHYVVDEYGCARIKVADVFPELKESEDEKIRKEIISALKYANHKGVYDKHIAWLEKQDSISANKVESKFNAGDWLIFNGITLHIDAVKDGYYITTTKAGVYNTYDTRSIDVAARPWTIREAKDGDVLIYPDGTITIFKKLVDYGLYMAYVIQEPHLLRYESTCTTLNCYPATKDQRETLMKAIDDAGNPFDFEKKELKKIEQKPTLSNVLKTAFDKSRKDYSLEEKEEASDYSESIIPTSIVYGESEEEYMLHKIIEAAYITGKNLIQNHVWNEEDKENISMLIDLVESKEESMEVQVELVSWLKSLKDRVLPKNTWKPTDEQMHYLYWIANVKLGDSVVEQEVSKHLNELYEDLKKLKNE